MDVFLRSLKAVLWAAIGLGGRRADAEQRTNGVGLIPLLLVAGVLTAALLGGLVLLARWAAAG